MVVRTSVKRIPKKYRSETADCHLSVLLRANSSPFLEAWLMVNWSFGALLTARSKTADCRLSVLLRANSSRYFG